MKMAAGPRCYLSSSIDSDMLPSSRLAGRHFDSQRHYPSHWTGVLMTNDEFGSGSKDIRRPLTRGWKGSWFRANSTIIVEEVETRLVPNYRGAGNDKVSRDQCTGGGDVKFFRRPVAKLETNGSKAVARIRAASRADCGRPYVITSTDRKLLLRRPSALIGALIKGISRALH